MLYTIPVDHVEKSIPSLLSIDVLRKADIICSSWLFRMLKNICSKSLLQSVVVVVEQIVKDSGRAERGSCLSSAYA